MSQIDTLHDIATMGSADVGQLRLPLSRDMTRFGGEPLATPFEKVVRSCASSPIMMMTCDHTEPMA
jgi:hypothetical protein